MSKRMKALLALSGALPLMPLAQWTALADVS